ncbi:hypothetical protein ACFSJ3_02395 [Corallincola platygyrae]|uniref:Uncharacterized protein n=1 Tax=Corallincola platygyrae TaxID=1193278 RepID=A0ABW4XII1_9GAMM
MSKAEQSDYAVLVEQGRNLQQTLDKPPEPDLDLASLGFEQWLTAVNNHAKNCQDRSELAELNALVLQIKQTITSRQDKTKELLLRSKRAGKGKNAYQNNR